MSTKTRILDAALALFNERGLGETSLRDIADACGISLGNLTYHFPKRDDVVMALYLQLVDRFDAIALRSPASLHDAMLETYAAFSCYRFLSGDLLAIMRGYPAIRRHYRRLTKRREREMLDAFAGLIKGGWMRPSTTLEERRLLHLQIALQSNFFLASAEVFHNMSEKEKQATFVALLSQTIRPFLTAKGKRALSP